MSKSYDPEHAPDPREWLALDESRRIQLAQHYHRSARIRLPSATAHAAIHAAVENQIAIGFGPTCRAMARLHEQGLSRHDAIHAIGGIIAACLAQAAGPNPPSPFRLQAWLEGELDELTADRWRSAAGEDDAR